MNLMLRRSRETEFEKHINGIKYAVFLKLTPLIGLRLVSERNDDQ
jgi:hypothetical protein